MHKLYMHGIHLYKFINKKSTNLKHGLFGLEFDLIDFLTPVTSECLLK